MTTLEALALSRKYTEETVEGAGAVKGKNCVIKSIEPVTGGHKVTFAWYLDDGTYETESMIVEDGAGIEDKEIIIREAVERAYNEIVANASQDYNTLEKIESIVSPIEKRLDKLTELSDEDIDDIFNK